MKCTSCRVEEGGKPKCRLGSLGAKTIEVRGNSLRNIQASLEAGRNVAYSNRALSTDQYDIIAVGGRPNWEDDKRGLPFQGEGGSKLVEFFERSGVDMNRVFVTLQVRCLPPKRRPSISEIKECRSHFEKELRLIQPKIVLLLGTEALKLFNLDKEGGINAIHGKVFERTFPGWTDGPTFKVIPTFDPSAFLHKANTSKERRALDDYRQLPSILKGTTPKPYYTPESIEIIDSLEKVDWLITQLAEARLFAWDTESPGLGFKKHPVMCLSFCWGYPGKVAVLPFYRHDPNGEPYKLTPVWNKTERAIVIDKLRVIFENPQIAKAAHHIKYDMNVIRNQLGIFMEGFIYDTMNMHHTLDEDPPHKLEVLADVELNYGDYALEVRKITGKGKKLLRGYDHIPDEILWPYTATDAEACYRLMHIYYAQLIKKPHLWKLYCEEVEPLLHALAEGESHGCKINLNITKDMIQVYENYQAELLRKMRGVTNPEFNPLSIPKLVEAIKKLGYGPYIIDEKAASGYATNQHVLTALGEEEEFFQWVLQYRTNRKMISTYLSNILRDVDKDGRVRYAFFQLTTSGRLSVELLHQIPQINASIVFDEHEVYIPLPKRQAIMRDMFVAEPGYKYVYADYCLSPASLVLKSDLTWVPICTIKPGDELVGFDENLNSNLRRRKFKKTTVEATRKRYAKCYKVSFSDGRTVVASSEHPWLVKKRRQGVPWEWIKTKDLKNNYLMADIGKPWTTDKSQDSGYLAGFFDGEGWVNRNVVGAAQKPGLVLDYVKQLLLQKGYKFTERCNSHGVKTLQLSGGKEGWRFLGSVRPLRLNSSKFWEGAGLPTRNYDYVSVSSVQDVGIQEVVSIQTSEKTFVAEGFVTHNSQVELRILAREANDEEMLRIFSDPEADIHLATCAEILGIPETGVGTIRIGDKIYQARASANRSAIGKPVNFGLAYGSQGYALLNTAQWTDTNGNKHNINKQLLQAGMKRWKKRFKGVGNYIDTLPDIGRMRGGIITNCFKRERRFGARLNLPNKFEREAAEREAINFPIQSAAGGLTNRTIILVHQVLQNCIKQGQLNRNDVFLVNTVHDSVAYECKVHLVPWFTEVLKTVGQRPIPELAGDVFEMKVGVGHSWTTAELAAT